MFEPPSEHDVDQDLDAEVVDPLDRARLPDQGQRQERIDRQQQAAGAGERLARYVVADRRHFRRWHRERRCEPREEESERRHQHCPDQHLDQESERRQVRQTGKLEPDTVIADQEHAAERRHRVEQSRQPAVGTLEQGQEAQCEHRQHCHRDIVPARNQDQLVRHVLVGAQRQDRHCQAKGEQGGP